jgi:rsbT co-antagonist protein RsbR
MDAHATKRLSATLASNRDAILEHWTQAVHSTVRGRLTRTELSRQLEDLLSALLALLDSGNASLDSPEAAELKGLLTEVSRSRARQGFAATETAVSVFGIKAAVLETVDRGDAQALADYATFSGLVDQLGLHTFDTYVNTREAVITEQATQLLELSTPVVKLWDGIVAVPLIGTLDSARSQVVMERLLQALVDTGSQCAILDITGVPAVDTQVAQHILKTVVAAQLMGAQCVISGIRPQIAQTIVALGIEFGEIVTKANLADALQYAMRQLGVEVSRRPGKNGSVKAAPAS